MRAFFLKVGNATFWLRDGCIKKLTLIFVLAIIDFYFYLLLYSILQDKIRGNFVYHHFRCTSIYRPKSYHFRSLSRKLLEYWCIFFPLHYLNNFEFQCARENFGSFTEGGSPPFHTSHSLGKLCLSIVIYRYIIDSFPRILKWKIKTSFVSPLYAVYTIPSPSIFAS